MNKSDKLSSLALANGEANNENKARTRKDTQKTQTVTTCDKKSHTTKSTPGYDRECSGTGDLDCKSGFVSTGSTTTTTSSCPWYCMM